MGEKAKLVKISYKVVQKGQKCFQYDVLAWWYVPGMLVALEQQV
jgi:hypothetical protein